MEKEKAEIASLVKKYGRIQSLMKYVNKDTSVLGERLIEEPYALIGHVRFCEGLLRLEPLIAEKSKMKGSEKSRQSLLDEKMINKTTKNPAAIRSRKALATALVNLLQERPLKEITVEDITSSAGLSRQTFYTNFSQKEDILVHSLNELFQQFTDGLWPLPDTMDGMLAFYFQFWSEHKKFLSVLFDNQLSHLFAIDNTYLFRNECSVYAEKAVKTQADLPYVENYLAGLTFQMLRTWQQNSWHEETEAITQVAGRLLKGDFFHG